MESVDRIINPSVWDYIYMEIKKECPLQTTIILHH